MSFPPTIPHIPPPSGYIPPSGTLVSGIFLFSVYPGLCTNLLIISGVGFPHIFEGANATYLFNTPSGVLSSTDTIIWYPVTNTASSITQLESGATTVTVVFKNISGNKADVYTQKVPETYNGWTKATTLSGMKVSDSAGNPDAVVSSNLAIIAGNTLSNSFSRIVRNDSKNEPIGNFADSDSGIPQTSPIAIITDLEAV